MDSNAAEYTLDYSVVGEYEYNDNVGLRTDDSLDISGGIITLPVTLTRRSERLESKLIGEVASSKFDESDFDSDDQDLKLKSRYQLERGEISGFAGYKRDSTRTTEFLDTGVVGQRATRVEKAIAGASAHYMFTEKNGIVVGGEYSDVEYDSPLYRDYDYISGNLGWQHQWTERTRLILQGVASRYENDADIEVTSDSLGAQAGFDTQFSEALSASLMAGWVDVDTDYSSDVPGVASRDDSDSVFQMNGLLRYNQERYELSAKVRSGTRPSGEGILNENHQVNVDYGYQVTERSRFSLGLVAGTNKSLDNAVDNERDYARARLRLDYRITESWYVAGAYALSYQDRERESGDANSNQFEISLIYDPEEFLWSR